MAFSLSTRTTRQFASQSPCSSVRGSRPRSTVVCKAVLNLEPKPRDVKQQRDVSVKANAGDEALPLPDSQSQQPDIQITPSFLDALIENTVKVPYVAYSTALRQYPLATKACTSMMCFILGDLIAQHFGHPHAAIDIMRVVRLGAYGLLIDGPCGSLWYDVLEQRVFPKEPLSTKAVLSKTALDQVVYATIMTGVYFAVIRLLEGHPEAIMSTLQSKFLPTLAANYMIWPLAHVINFRFIPSEFRILYNNVVCIAWLTGLSFLTHSKINFMQLLPHLPHGH
jgi:protein Mpv17